ncbi:hypothetical protein IEQ34_022411 [Dendrobium chrysotoxum]|uniref:Uncharacterized protein n=1 Tax=Dendrobium chrysotoxum TaxID=161865 RepID=A0AAV7FXS6_DENCH|nr:hypothetical protein IEQ34_022411 [Dendrobium chrysotoxum]
MDNGTSNGTRPSVARVLVELDVTKRYPDQVWLGSESLGYIHFVEMEVFPSYYVHCKALGNSKLECHILHPHLAEAPTSTPIAVNVGDMANLSMPENVDNLKPGHPHLASNMGDKVTKVMNDNVQGNAYDDLFLHETVAPTNAGHVYGDLGQSVELDSLVSDEPMLPLIGHDGGEGAFVNDLVPSPVVEKNPKEIESGSFHGLLNEVNMGLCVVNTMVLNDSSSGLVIASVDSPVASIEPALSPCTMGLNGNAPLIDALIALIFTNTLKA